MLISYAAATGLNRAPDEAALLAADWIDLDTPTEDEVATVQRLTGLRVPTRPELSEIESSSRLATADGVFHLSMPWLVGVKGGRPRNTVLGFVVTPQRVLSIRFGESLVMRTFMERIGEHLTPSCGPVHVFAGILEAVVDRFADVLEEIGGRLEKVSGIIFDADTERSERPRREDLKLRASLRDLGRAGDIVARLRDSLLAVGRIAQYVQQSDEKWLTSAIGARLDTLLRDVHSLSDHDSYLIDKIQFLQDAILGFITIAQNNVMKVLTVVSVVGIPPTLIASIYGMNFKLMPELEWTYGYPYGLAMIALSAIAPLVIFRLRGWL